MSLYDDYLAGRLTSEQLAQMANRTQGAGAPSASELISAPPPAPGYHNSVGDSPAGYTAPTHDVSSLLRSLAASGQPASAPPPMPALVGSRYTPNASAPMPGNLTQSSVPQFTPAANLLDHATTLNAGLYNQSAMPLADVSNASVGDAPQQPQSLLSRLASGVGRAASAVGHVAATGFNNFETNISGLTPAQMATMTPQEIAQAKRIAFSAFANRVANPTYDQGGFRQNAWEAMSSGIPSAGEAAQGYFQRNAASKQYATQQAQSADLLARRRALQAQFSISPSDSPADVDAKVQQLAAGYAQIGDTQSLQALGQASSLFRQPKPPAAPRALEHVETIDPKTGKPAIGMIDPATGEVVKYLPSVVKPAAGAGEMSADRMDKSIERVVRTYDHETADFTKARSGYQIVSAAVATPNLYAPYAILDGFSRLVNPNSVVRPSTLELLKETGSASDKVSRWASLIESGQWPADLTAALKKTADTIMRNHFQTAQQSRGRALLRLRQMHVPDAESQLDELDYGASPSAATTAAPRPANAAPATGNTARGNY
jgi:hypothetical protein